MHICVDSEVVHPKMLPILQQDGRIDINEKNDHGISPFMKSIYAMYLSRDRGEQTMSLLREGFDLLLKDPKLDLTATNRDGHDALAIAKTLGNDYAVNAITEELQYRIDNPPEATKKGLWGFFKDLMP